jgi:hypothetical protein
MFLWGRTRLCNMLVRGSLGDAISGKLGRGYQSEPEERIPDVADRGECNGRAGNGVDRQHRFDRCKKRRWPWVWCVLRC